MTGAFVCIVGPSGAGKDTLIDGARRALAGDGRFDFPRRIVTRQPSSAEDHDSISPGNFDIMQGQGAFALTWAAHGLRYAIPAHALEAVASGRVTVSNLSRGAVAAAERRFPSVRVVLVTAPREVLSERLLARGREAPDKLHGRLEREALTAIAADLTITNVGPADLHVAALVRFLRSLLDQDHAAATRLGVFAS